MPVLLAIETSQHVGGIALCDLAGDGDVHVEMLSQIKRHDDDLMPAIDRLFARLNLQPRDLHAVAVSIGPGGFTGLRIAVTTAKMFAETLGVKIIAVPSAMVAAESWRAGAKRDENRPGGDPIPAVAAHPIIVALACKGESCWCTRLQRIGDNWQTLDQPGLRDASTLDLHEVAALLGDAHLPDPLRRRCHESGVQVIEPEFDPRACLAIAQQMLRDGIVADPLKLVPLYPREPEAVTIWNQRKAK